MGELKKWRDQDWVRIDSSGNIAGKCGTSKDKTNPDGTPMKISMGHKGKFEVIEVIDEGSRSRGIIGKQIFTVLIL